MEKLDKVNPNNKLLEMGKKLVENKNAPSVEYTNVSVKNVLKMVEENLKNAKKNKTKKIILFLKI